mmetsp:Transcript_119339/g.371755  ORF Transcript_119339/g.371755 Transcript_119339/m.371755 type:complete len:238 (+) Transcript_119339:59-772(+)
MTMAMCNNTQRQTKAKEALASLAHQFAKLKLVLGFFTFCVTFAYSSSSSGSSCCSSFFFSAALTPASSKYLPTALEFLFLWASMGSRRLLNHCATGSTTFSSTFGLAASALTSLKGFLNTSVLISFISFFGLSLSSVSQLLSTSSSCRPPTTRPKTECRLSKCWQDFSDTKNWLRFVFFPLLAMLTTPGPWCIRRESNSSLKARPPSKPLSPPLPVPVGSPPCIMKLRMRRWNGVFS